MIVQANPRGWTKIGRLGENEYRVILFPCQAIYDEIPDAAVTVLHQRPGDPDAYPVNPAYVQVVEGRVYWTVTSADVSKQGRGTAQLVFTSGGEIAKDIYYTTEIDPALDGSGTPPEPWESWQQQFAQKVQAAEDAAEDARGWANGTDKNGNPVSSDDPHYHNNAYYFSQLCLAMTGKYPQIGSNGNWKIWDATNSAWVDTEVPATGPAGQDGTDGTDGTDGVSPTITVTDITGGHRITVTDADGEHTFDVMDGTTPTVPVQDVQVNGTSILSQGVANVPIAGNDVLGLVKVASDGATTGIVLNPSNYLRISPATSSEIKLGTAIYKTVGVNKQKEATFYSLAKAAGDTTQSSSSNSVGTYTDAAKIAIQKMLGIYEAPWELIRADTGTNETETTIEIAVDGNGEAFELTDIRLVFHTPTQETAASVAGPGRVKFFYDSNANDTLYIGAYTQAAGATGRTSYFNIEQHDGMIERTYNKNTVNNGEQTIIASINVNLGALTRWEKASKTYIKIVIEGVTGTWQYKLYGKRKWTA